MKTSTRQVNWDNDNYRTTRTRAPTTRRETPLDYSIGSSAETLNSAAAISFKDNTARRTLDFTRKPDDLLPTYSEQHNFATETQDTVQKHTSTPETRHDNPLHARKRPNGARKLSKTHSVDHTTVDKRPTSIANTQRQRTLNAIRRNSELADVRTMGTRAIKYNERARLSSTTKSSRSSHRHQARHRTTCARQMRRRSISLAGT